MERSLLPPDNEFLESCTWFIRVSGGHVSATSSHTSQEIDPREDLEAGIRMRSLSGSVRYMGNQSYRHIYQFLKHVLGMFKALIGVTGFNMAP